ncbi:MAG: DUF2267 domain-containing protein, partial [Chitinivibrionales bacterium]|nr:DUF2267 domain-containing protein [Chitinivibrionales bacterium]
LDVYDTSIQKSEIWLKDVMGKLSIDDRHRAHTVLRSVLHAVRDRLTDT